MTLLKYSSAPAGKSGHMFSGIGGDTRGFEEAGWEIGWGANHSKRNIETWSANFASAEWLCADMDHYDMNNLPPAQVLFASPICKEVSPAGGRKRRQGRRHTRGQLALMEHGNVDAATWERTRATAYDIIRAAEVWRYDAVCWENVTEFAEWEMFDWWVQGFGLLGYRHAMAFVSAAHIGGAGNEQAPQWRDRVVGAFVRDGIPLPDLTPRPAGKCTGCGEDVQAVQVWRDPNAPKRGKYEEQYDYVSPHLKCRNPIVKPYVRPILEVVDWSNLGPKMSERVQGYVPATIARVERGIADYGSGVDAEPFVTILRNNCTAQSVREPLSTVTSGGTHHYLTTPSGAEVAVEQIRRTVVAPYYSSGVPKSVMQPLDTLTTRDRHWLVTLASRWQDCNYRRFTPREQAAAQRFAADYVLTGNLGEQTAGIGNAVPVNVSRWAGERVMAVLDGKRLGEEG